MRTLLPISMVLLLALGGCPTDPPMPPGEEFLEVGSGEWRFEPADDGAQVDLVHGSQEVGDEYVRICLEMVMAEPHHLADGDLKVQLFRAFHAVWTVVTTTISESSPLECVDLSDRLEQGLTVLPPLVEIFQRLAILSGGGASGNALSSLLMSGLSAVSTSFGCASLADGELEVILDRQRLLPKAMQVHLPNGSRHVYMFDIANASINSPLAQLQALFKRPITPLGWKRVVENMPLEQAAQPVQPAR